MSTPNSPPKPKPAKTNRVKQVTIAEAMRMSSQDRAARRRAYKQLLQVTRKRRAALKKYNHTRFALDTIPRCSPSTQVYGGASQGNKKWICSRLHQITFREKNYDIRECEVRVFIEGAEVTPYIRGNVAWSIQTTGGMNNCTFSLNNNHDAFILTPANVCSRTDLHGWRVPLDKKKRLITAPSRISRNVDETAKYIIYKHKYDRVRPGTKSQQIDEAGFWLYPLNPFFCILNKHDCVRVFYRLPHVTSACKVLNKKGHCLKVKGQEYDEVWAPAFTGFIDEYDYEDDPVIGDRVVNVRCYDWRGLLNRMRVRMQPTSSVSAAARRAAEQSTPIFSEQRNAAKKDKNKGATQAFLDVASDLGVAQDLNALYSVRFRADIEANCKKGKNYQDCTKKVHEHIRKAVSNKIVEMKRYYLGSTDTSKEGATKIIGLVPAIKNLKEAEGIEAKPTRVKSGPNEGTIEVNYSGGVKTASAAIAKAVKFLRTTGKIVEDLASSYALAYPQKKIMAGLRVLKEVPIVNLNGPKSQVRLCTVYNQTAPIKALDTFFAETSKTYRKIYDDAAIATNPKVSRVYLLNQYMTAEITAMFSGVAKKIKTKLDENLRYQIKRTLFGLAKGGSVFDRAPIAFTAPKISIKVATAMSEYITGGSEGDKSLVAKGRIAQAKITDMVKAFNGLYQEVKVALNTAMADENAALKRNPNARKRSENNAVLQAHEKARSKSSPVKSSAKNATVADIALTDARFDQASIGMYGDLIRASGRDSHPLAGMSFEMAVEWLTLTHTPISKGFEDKLKTYDRNSLQTWNLNVLFGVIGRPLTYREVTAMGVGSLGDLSPKIAPYSPLHAFMHMLLPADGTGAASIVQQDITNNIFGVKNYDYETRLQLLNKICATLDYQFFVSPAGDLVFEFPNYNALPYDFGRVFQGAYTIVKGLRSFKVASEQGELNTAWVISGTENERALENTKSAYVIDNSLNKTVIVANMLARRIGVKVRHIKIEMPGVGAIFGADKKGGGAEASRMAFGLLEIQRELGRMETASVNHDFRPYMLPNRPVHIVHRQRMALIKSVNYSMMPPNGECTTSLDLHYVRGLHQDGTFRHMAGGTRLPVDYSGLFIGETARNIHYGANPRLQMPGSLSTFKGISTALLALGGYAVHRRESQRLKESVLETTGQRKPQSFTNWSCSSFLRDRWITASFSYSDQMDASFRKADRYSIWTQGADGMTGDYPPLPRGGASYIASRSYRPTSSSGSRASAVSLPGSGLNIATTGGADAQTPKKSVEGAYYGNLYNPWPYGRRLEGHLNLFNQFGFYRVIYRKGTVSYKDKKIYDKEGRLNHRGKTGGWHNGIDFNGDLLNAPAYTPIALVNAHLCMGVGWSSYNPAQYVWSRVYPLTTHAPTDKADALYWVRRGKKKSPPIMRLSSDLNNPGVQFKLDGVMMKLYKKVKEKYKGGKNKNQEIQFIVSRRYGSNVGMMLIGWGYASMPGNASSKLACELRYIHTGDLIKHPTSNHYIGHIGLPKQARAIPADTPVIKVGATGTSNVHLHFEMAIFKPGTKAIGLGTVDGDDSSYKEVVKANADFLRTQMKMRVSAGGVGDLNKNTLSSSWQRYFADLNKRSGKSITTVDQAVEYMLDHSAEYKRISSPSSTKVTINPMFFFRPEQIIKKYADKYQKYLREIPKNYYDAGSSPCGPANARVQQKIALEYSVCLGQVKRKFRTAKNRRDARAICKLKMGNKKAKLTQRKTASGTTQQTGGGAPAERVHRKVDARVKASAQRASNLAARANLLG